MIKNKEQRVAVFVDVQNMYYTARHLYNSKVNFSAVMKEAVADRKLIRAIAYCIKAELPEEKPFFEALTKSGFEVKTKDLQVFVDGTKKGDWDVGLAMDVIKMAPAIDAIIIISGDGDYIPLVEYCQNHGKIVEAVAFGRSASAGLIARVDDFLDLETITRKILLKFREPHMNRPMMSRPPMRPPQVKPRQ